MGERMRKPWTIRTRLIFVMLMMSFLSLAAFAVLSQLSLRAGMRRSLQERIAAGLERSDRCLTLTLEKYSSLLYDLSTDDGLIGLVRTYNVSGRNTEEIRTDIRRNFGYLSSRLDGVAGLAVFTEDGTCVYYDGLAASSTGSLWLNSGMDRLEGETEICQPLLHVETEENGDNYVFYIQRRLIDFRNADEEVGSVLICVEERILQEAMQGNGGAFFCLEHGGRVVSAPDPAMLGQQIKTGKEGSIGDRSYEAYQTAVIRNEKCGWNIVEFYPLKAFNQTMERQLIILLLMLGATGVVLVLSILFAIRPVLLAVENLLTAMQMAEEGDYSVRVQRGKSMPVEVVRIFDVFDAMVERTQQLLEQNRQAALEQKNAEISALEAQIDPHFLYNTLDGINWKAISHGEYEISEMLGDLADILRYAIRNAGGTTSLGQEMVWLRKYVRLQQEKLGKEIQVFDDITPEAAACPMHKLLLQPFVENSIRHGLTWEDREPFLIITGAVEEGFLCVKIRDNGRGLPPERLALLNRTDYHRENHFGVENVRKRLRLYYGDEAGVSFSGRQGEYMEAMLRIPVLKGDMDADRNRGG